MAIPGGSHFKGTCLQKPTMLARGKASTTPGMVANVVAKEGMAIVVTVAAGTLTAEEPKFFLANHWQFPGTKTPFFCCVFREITSENPADDFRGKRPKWRRRGGQSKVDGLKELDIFCCLGEVKFLKTLEYYPPVHFNCKMRGLVFSKKWVSGVIFLVPHARRALVFFSRKHFWHSLKKHVVGFKLVFKNQSSFFSETSSLNPINIQELNRPFFSKCSWEGKAKKEQFIHLLFFSFNIHLFFLFTCIFFSFCFFYCLFFLLFFVCFCLFPNSRMPWGRSLHNIDFGVFWSSHNAWAKKRW